MARIATNPFSFTCLATNLAIASATGVNIIDTVNLPAGSYNITAVFTSVASGTIGGTSSFSTSTAQCTGQIFTQLWTGTATAPLVSAASTTLNQSLTTGVHTTGAVYVWTVTMNVVVSSPGTVQFQAIDSLAADSITVQAGSYASVIKVA